MGKNGKNGKKWEKWEKMGKNGKKLFNTVNHTIKSSYSLYSPPLCFNFIEFYYGSVYGITLIFIQ